MSKVWPFISKYNQERINYPSETDDEKRFEKNSLPMLQNNLKYEKQAIL